GGGGGGERGGREGGGGIEGGGVPRGGVIRVELEEKDEERYRQLAGSIEEACGHLDGVLLNAGVLGQRTMLDNYHWDTWQKVMQINVNSQFILMKHLLPLLQKAPADASVRSVERRVGEVNISRK